MTHGNRVAPGAPDYSIAIPVIRGALALAAEFFPRRTADGKTYIRTADALFLLSGQTDKWSRWQHLPMPDKALITRLLRWRPVEIANRNVFADLLDILIPGHIHDFRVLADGTVLVEVSRPAREVAEDCAQQLWLERQVRQRHPMTIANKGSFVTWIRGHLPGSGFVQATYSLDISPKTQPESPIDLGAPAQAEQIAVPVSELEAIAASLDAAFGEQHRMASMQRIFTKIQADPANHARRVWTLRAGTTRTLNAPTGIGKNVVAELLACWCAQRGKVTTLLVPSNAAVIRAAASIEVGLRALGIDADVVPLMSPDAAQKEAEAAATRGPGNGALGLWAYQRLSYGCALPAAAQAEGAVDAWDPGAEPCTSLRRVKDDGAISGGRWMCPWKPSCGKFRLARQACRASVVVTSHVNFFAGRLHVPVMIDGRVEENLPIEELLLYRSHLVLMDEIDAFQASMISHSARHLDLANRRGEPWSPLRQFDSEFNGALGRIDTRIEGRVQAALAQARYLAENYNRHLAAGHFRRSRNGRSPGHPMFGRWLLPRRWDAWLAAILFNLPDGQQPSDAHYKALQAVFPLERREVPLPEWLEPVAVALAQLTSSSSGYDPFDETWSLIFGLLAKHPYDQSRLDDDNIRAEATDRLIRRAYLEPLRKLLFTFAYAAPQLHASGVQAATEIANALSQYAAWRAAPYGPMGRVLFAFTEIHDEDRPLDTTLRVSGFGGDPHTYVATVGELTALAHTGNPRIVVGLSATGYFPGAPHHHVHVLPAWWVPDDETGGVVIRAAPVSDEERRFLRVSGTYGPQRTVTLIELGRLLWVKRLAPALRALSANPDCAHRARLLLATTAYQGARDLAEGLSLAGVPADKLVLAVRPGDAANGGRGPCSRWTELPADRLEEFGRAVGTTGGSVLIAPLARAERSINIVDDAGRPLIGSVWLIVRPVPIIDEPPQLLAHVNARAHAEAAPADDPSAVLDLMRIAAGKHYDELFSSLPYFCALPDETQLAMAREILNGLIQLAGRARRGGEVGEIWLVDYAFHDTSGNSDLPSLIRRIRAEWERDGHLDLMRSLYGETLNAIFSFADERKPDQ
jgi:hypothetical protein